ncbi:MAG: helix-turn-helix transcriptional regulator [Caulobacter sp.]|nr:helix-turn-helix transcriptional regulator [Caulobacter sp.]
MRGLSQEALAQRLGLTFQQVQKYERGANRISASKLYEIARALEVPVAALFDGAPGPGPTDADSRLKGTVERLMLEDGGAELAELYPRIRSPDVRRALVRMVRAVVEGQALP